MTDAWRGIALTECEHVVTGPSQSLLRVGGRAPDEQNTARRPVLVIEAADTELHFRALRAPADRAGILRAAYDVPTALLQDGRRCWLELTDRTRIALPVPGAARQREDPEGRGDAAVLEQAQARVSAAEQDAQRARQRVAAVERELDQARDQLRLMTLERDELSRQAAAFDAVAVKARERASAVEAASANATSTLNELQVWRGELERRLTDTTNELAVLRAAREADQRELMRLRSAPMQYARDTVPAAGGENGDGAEDELVAAQAQEIQRLAAELAELRSRTARTG